MLAPLLQPRTVAGLRLDVHLRAGDHVHAYCGLTRVIDAWITAGGLRLDAAETYRRHPSASPLFRPWALNDPTFSAALHGYLSAVVPDTRWTRHEGAVQVAWSGVQTPWVPFDREAVIAYESRSDQARARTATAIAIAAARAEIELSQRAGSWAPPDQEPAAELDQLAVDPEGRLVLIELKYGPASGASVFYAPLQLLQYVHEWHAAFGELLPELNALRAARVAVGLSPASTPTIVGGLRPVVAFGEELCSPEVRARLVAVRAIVNRHLPPAVPPIELWAMRGGVPTPLPW
jgi:hypothetical protein